MEAVTGLREALKELGFEDGKQVLDVRDTRGDLKAVEAAAKAFEAAKVDLIVSVGSSTTVVVKRATQSARIVFDAGFAANLGRSGLEVKLMTYPDRSNTYNPTGFATKTIPVVMLAGSTCERSRRSDGVMFGHRGWARPLSSLRSTDLRSGRIVLL